jgi:hypothetical protein
MNFKKKIFVTIILTIMVLMTITVTIFVYSKKNPDSSAAYLIRKIQIITINYLHLAMWFEYDEWTSHKVIVDMSDLEKIKIKKIYSLDLFETDLLNISNNIVVDTFDPIFYKDGFAYERCYFDKKQNHLCDNVIVPNNGKAFNRLNPDCKTSYPISFLLGQKTYWMFEEYSCGKGLYLYSLKENKFEVTDKITDMNVFDPTPLVVDEKVYIFGTNPEKGLMMWKMQLINDKFIVELDNRSPLSNNKNSNRFGGNIFKIDNNYYGVLMNNELAYGKSLNLHRLDNLDNTGKILTKINKNLLPDLVVDKYHTFSLGNCDKKMVCEALIDLSIRKKQSFHSSKYHH